MLRVARQMTVALLVAVTAAACSSAPNTVDSTAAQSDSPTSSTASATSQADAGDIAEVPWSDVGPGWTLATWTPLAATRPGEEPEPGEPTWATVATTLFLVDPAGQRYAVAEFPPPGEQGGTPLVVDWSGDGNRALVYMGGAPEATVIDVDLRSGAQTPIPAPGEFGYTAHYTRPEGKAILLSTSEIDDKPATLRRVDLTGTLQLTYPTDQLDVAFNSSYLSTPDGTRLVLGTDAGLVLMGNDGTPGAPLSLSGQGECRPLRWWDGDAGTTVLANCSTPETYVKQLWLVPIDGGAATALTAPNDGQQMPDLGDADAWQLPSGTFVQALSACGTQYLAKLEADGTTTPVTVPQVDENNSVEVVGADGSGLLLQAELACGPGKALLRFDPVANTSTVLLGPPVNDGGVTAAVLYPGQD